MAAAAPQSQSQQPLSAEDEALKRNTDCVYFLASPLTCKKGSECEYRHSDIARLNPRDCWYWLNSNCLNPKCAFRHPPLDGLLGTQVPASSGPSVPVTQAVATPTPHVPNASAKPGVPCVFFQKGYCMKGDWCPFVHFPSALNNKPSLVPRTASPAEPATIKKAFSGLEKTVQEKVRPMNAAKPVNDSTRAKPMIEVEPAPTRNEFAANRRVPQSSVNTKFPGYRSAPPVSNGNPISWSSHAQQPHLLDEPESMNNKDAEEVSREPSPGFDVLVDDEGRDSDYYPGEDRYAMSLEHEARNEYDVGHSTDYNTVSAVDDERYQGPLGYDSHDHRKGQYGWEQRRASSERMSGGSYLERRAYGRPDSQVQVDGLDLRHRLAKHKKQNGLRSVISHEHTRVEDRSYRGVRRDEQHTSLRENSLSSRLRGRISLPGRSSSPNDRDMIRGNDRGRFSPVRSSVPSHQGRIRDNVRGRVEEGFNVGEKNYRGQHLRRDNSVGDNGGGDFAAPKSLAELKNRKNAEPSRQHQSDELSLGKRKHLMLDENQPSGNDASFEGPKPLVEILKRKRGEPIGNESSIEDKNQGEIKDATKNETITPIGNHEEIDNSSPVQKIEAGESRPSASNKVEAEEGMLVEDGESDYEQGVGEDYELYDGENGDGEGEYLDEEDDDDEFAKKMGVVYS